MLIKASPAVVIAFPGGKGTGHMKQIAKAAGVKVIEVSDTGWKEAGRLNLDIGDSDEEERTALNRQGILGSEAREGSWEQTRARPLTDDEKMNRDYLYYMTPDADDVAESSSCEACGNPLSAADGKTGQSICQLCMMEDEMPAFRGDGRLDIL